MINDISSNPPSRTNLLINQGLSMSELALVGFLGLDASLLVWPGLDVYIEDSRFGIRSQILNFGEQEEVWVGAIHGAYGEKTDSILSTSSNIESVSESKVISSQVGVSLGYRYTNWVPYFSYIYEVIQISTKVTNGGGRFGPYSDEGKHSYYSLGVTSPPRKGLSYSIEYNMIDIAWV